MDYETKIYLEKLIEAVDSPDWWSISITSVIAVINAAFMIWIGFRQNNMQEQQIKQQEYDLYRRLYKLFLSIHNTANGLIFKIYSHIAMGDLTPYTLDKISNEIEQLSTELKNANIDVKLKMSEEDNDRCDQYNFLISTMVGLVNRVIVFDKNNQIKKPDTVDMNTILNNIKKEDNYLIPIILSQIKENDLKEDFKSMLIGVSVMKTKFCEEAFLEKIKAKI